MYFWNINNLVHELKAGMLSEYEKMKYLLATVLLQVLALYNTQHCFDSKNVLELIILSLLVGLETGVIVWGIYHCFVINKQNDNKNFIERYICLGFPLGIRIFIFSVIGISIGLCIALGVLVLFVPNAYLIFKEARGAETKTFSWLVIQHLYFLSISIIYYLMLGKKIDEVSRE